jgi:alpha-1,6-mannosyltransferase
MKVVDVTEFYSERGGGVRSYLEGKQHILCQLGHQSIMFAPGPTARSTQNVIRLGGPPLPYDPTYHLLWRPDKIREAIAAESPDVLEIHSPYVAAVGALMAPRGTFGIRTFVWHSDFIDTYERVLHVPIPLWGWVRKISRACAATFCASAWQVSKLARHGVTAEHLPFGVDKETFHPRDREPHEGILLVASGRLAIEKRFDVVIDAMNHLPDARLVVYGDGPERARLERRAPKNVNFAGFTKDREALARALAEADAFVHGCPHETFGIAVAEAIACGTPVVVPDLGGAAELARGSFAERYTSGDPVACAAAIRALLRRDRTPLRDAAIAASRDVLSTREHFERLLARYEALLETCSGASRRGRAKPVA